MHVASSDRMLLRRAVPAALMILAAAGCRLEPTGAAAWEPPPVYREWFAKTEACSGLRGRFDRIDWYVVPGHSFPCDGGDCTAHWSSDHTIHIAEDWVASEMVVRHEILHDLLGRAGHPEPPFGSPCPLTWETWPASGGSAVRSAHLRID
jgi:hypothetical protein